MLAEETFRGPSHAATTDPRRALGRLGEDLAAAHLERLGFEIVARNARTRHGEIDLIAFDGRTLVVAEVKTRRVSSGRHAASTRVEPLEGLLPSKRARVRRLAAAWLSETRAQRRGASDIRFDAVGVIVDERGRLLHLEHLEAAW